MEICETKKPLQKEHGPANGFTKEITTNTLEWLDHVTAVDLSNKHLTTLEDNIKFPPNLVHLNLSHNRLTEIPLIVLNHEKFKSLDISYNEIQYFNDPPSFCHTIEELNLSHNCLLGPPQWVWTEYPSDLITLDLSFNINISKSFQDGYIEELLQYETSVVNLKVNNCCLKDSLKLLCTFPRAKVLNIGSEQLANVSLNEVIEIPFEGIEHCCDILSLNLSNTHLYNIKNNIDIFSCLVELNLSQNYLSGLPSELCNLHNLEICILSYNAILYLPDDIGKLQKLIKLSVDSNELCMLPDSIVELTNLQYLDVYNNYLYEIPEKLNQVLEMDLAQNYFDEPCDSEYSLKKEKLRLNISDRFDGRKAETVIEDSEHSPDTSDDESYLQSIVNNSNTEPQKYDLPSSPEDWDSDVYWVPRFCSNSTQNPRSTWLYFVKRKMQEGNFCPVDAHIDSIAEKVKYEKMCKPQPAYESDGQFDDFSEDDS